MTGNAAVRWDAGDDRTWIRRGTAPVTTLEQDRWTRIGPAGARCFQVTGSRSARFHTFTFINGFHYMTSDGTTDDVMRQRQETFRDDVASFETQGTSYWLAIVRPEVEGILGRLRRAKPRGGDLAGLVAYLRLAADADAAVMGDLHGRLTAAATYDWPATFEDLTGLPQSEATVLVQALDHASARLVRRIRHAALLVQRDRALRQQFTNRGPTARHFGGDFDQAVALILRKYGRRTGTGYGSATTLESPTWSMKPTLLHDLIERYVDEDLDRLDSLDEAAGRQRRALHRSLRRRLSSSPATLAAFDLAIRRAQGNVQMLEDHNALMEQETWGTFREALHMVAVRLVTDGLIEDTSEIFHLALDDLDAAARAESSRRNLQATVDARAAQLLARRALDAPPLLGPGAPAAATPPATAPTAPTRAAPGDVLVGVGASPGVITGPAHVAFFTEEIPDVPDGAILVARDAGPAWTPIFPLLAGIILEGGAPFQHAAIMARHYRIPAVIGVRHATSVLMSNQAVTVDGAQGTVTVGKPTTGDE